jgi:hypothetical protein
VRPFFIEAFCLEAGELSLVLYGLEMEAGLVGFFMPRMHGETEYVPPLQPPDNPVKQRHLRWLTGGRRENVDEVE